MIVGARQGGLNISETADLLGFSVTIREGKVKGKDTDAHRSESERD